MHRVHLVLVGRGKLKGQRQSSRAREGGGKARWCEIKQTCQNPSKTRQARRGRSAPKSKATVFSPLPLCQKTPLLERRGTGCALPGRAEEEGVGLWHCPCIDRREHGPLLLSALLTWSLFFWGTPVYVHVNSLLSLSTPRETSRNFFVATRLKGSTLSFPLLLAKVAKKSTFFLRKTKKQAKNTRDLTKLDSVTVFKNIFIDALQVIKCKKQKILLF